jgi:hypothetical protein
MSVIIGIDPHKATHMAVAIGDEYCVLIVGSEGRGSIARDGVFAG